MPPPRRLSRAALAGSVALHVVLLLTITIEGRLFQPERAPQPRVTVVELPPLGGGRPAPALRNAPPLFAGPPRAEAPDSSAAAPVLIGAPQPVDSAAPLAVTGTGYSRIGPGLARGRLWVRPLPLPPRELAQRLTRSHEQLVDSAVTAVIQAFLDSVAMDPASRGAQLPSWTTTVAGSKFGLDSKWLYVAGLRIPAAVLALLPLPSAGNESRAFDRSGEMYRDLRAAAQRSATLDEFKGAIKEIRERKEQEREFERNQRSEPPRPTLEPDPDE
jgi:hypothetical protein